MIDRRTFVSSLAASAAPTLLAAAHEQPATTSTLTAGMVREFARVTGLPWTEAECQDVADWFTQRASFLGTSTIGRDRLTNASPLPLHFDPRPPGVEVVMPRAEFRAPAAAPRPRPTRVEEMAFWSIADLAAMVRSRRVSSIELTRMYLDRLARHNGALNCVVNLTESRALAEAAAADREIAAGRYRGPLHGLPYGVKDIIAASGAPTTWGNRSLADQRIDEDATVVHKLRESGAVLVAKLSTGELAWGDQWARGRTNNPWNVQEGSSGSSAGSGAAVSAGLVAFAIGSDTGGSILSPAERCGVVGFRPTFGTVSRHGVMAAGTSLDKIGPMCRSVNDCALVLQAIAGPDGFDRAVPDRIAIAYDGTTTAATTRVGYDRALVEGERDAEARRNIERVLGHLKAMGCSLQPITLPVSQLTFFIEYTERAAAFEGMVRAGLPGDMLPFAARVLRAHQMVTAVDYLQANRRRASIMEEVARAMAAVDVLLFTRLSLDSQTSANPVLSLTGHPAIAVPSGFSGRGTPTAAFFSGHLYRDGALLRFAKAFEDVATRSPLVPPAFVG